MDAQTLHEMLIALLNYLSDHFDTSAKRKFKLTKKKKKKHPYMCEQEIPILSMPSA